MSQYGASAPGVSLTWTSASTMSKSVTVERAPGAVTVAAIDRPPHLPPLCIQHHPTASRSRETCTSMVNHEIEWRRQGEDFARRHQRVVLAVEQLDATVLDQ